MVKTRRSTDSHGIFSSEMPVRASTSADNIDFDEEIVEEIPRRYSEGMDETVRNVRRRESRDRELRNRVVISNGSRSSTRIRDVPDRYMPPRSTSKRGILLRPRSDGHMNYLRHLARNDEADTVTEEDVGSDVASDDDHIFTPESKIRRRARRVRSLRSLDSPATVTFAEERAPRMSNGHSSVALDDSHEGVRRSTRERKLKYTSFNQSWILGTQNVRGYRMPRSPGQDKEDQTEEEEEDSADDEPREEEEEEEEKVNEEGETGEGEEGDAPNAEEQKQQQEDGNEVENQENFEDMYSRVKRPRRTRQAIMFSEVKNTRSRTRKLAGSSDDGAQSSDEGNTRSQRPQSPRRRSKYHLRQRKPKVQHFQNEEPLRHAALSLIRSPMRRKRGRTARFNRSDSSDSTSDSEYERKKGRNRNRCLPVHFASADHLPKTSRDTVKPVAGGSLADTDPMALDPNVRFSHVGGLDEHIRCLKEMVVFPMLYPEIFEKFKVQPPKGVLFHGPPGTGKTLLARALANECSQGERRVAFFMRKGADCLSKWVGESERQLRLLFDQAYQMRPSIIFFDELDGLAPIRSCKQDQIHASIVSTLLALMDGLKNRGDVLLIGATNRIDAIDPALRRPGRFDRELYFPLPAVKERQEILQIHMSEWEQAPPPPLVSELAEMASGYCGSDLQALCTEAVIHGLRRRYPQIYESSQKLLLDTTRVTVEKCDFQRAKLGIVPAAHRVACAPSHRLVPLVRPLLETCLTNVVNSLKISFPHANMKSAVNCKLLPAPVPHPRLLLTGTEAQGHIAHIGPALLHHMEHVSIHSLELGMLFGTPGTSPEEIIVQTFREARRQVPAVVYIPEIDSWWGLVPQTVHGLVKSRLTSLEPGTALLLLATAHCNFPDLPEEVQDMFSEYRGEVFEMPNPSLQERDAFFRPVFLTKPLLPPPEVPKKIEQLEQLPLAPPPAPPKLTEDQEKQLYKKEETTLRELRIFLREICAKLARNKQFFIFVQPVDLEEAPDYLEIIKQPMDLETIMSKIDRHEYACAAEFLADVNLVCNNALEYNPDRSNQGKMIRHRACYLHDTAHALIKAEMDSDFEDQCKEISQNRKKRAFVGNKLAPEFVYTAPIKPVIEKTVDNDNSKDAASTSKANNDSVASSIAQDDDSGVRKSLSFNSSTDSKHKKRRSPWARGMLPSKKRKRIIDDKEGTSPGTDTGGRQTPSEEPEEENGEHSGNEDVKEEAMSIPKSPDAKPLDTSTVINSPIKELNQEDEEGVVAMTSIIEPISSEAEAAMAEHSEELGVKVNKGKLEALLSRALTITTDLPVAPLLDLHAQLCRIVHTHSTHLNRSAVPQQLEAELERFEKLVSSQYK